MRRVILVFLLLTSSILARDLLAIASNNILSDSSSKRLSDSELSEVVGGFYLLTPIKNYTYLANKKPYSYTSISRIISDNSDSNYVKNYLRNLTSSSNEYAAIYYNYNYQTRSEYVNLVVFNPYYKSIRTINMSKHPDAITIINTVKNRYMNDLRRYK